MIGRYKLLERIGEGGFGVVYMAEQLQPVRRQVALKVIKLGMDTRQVIARFEAERQALALMDHPNIAKVLDAGATETGRPYFVMELVHGVPITEYLRREQADHPRAAGAVRRRFARPFSTPIKRASSTATSSRPTSWSRMHEGRPVPKVIDFGVAKATQSAADRARRCSPNFAQMIGTPLYMSPEQAEMTDSTSTRAATCIRSGVLLYELLTGTTPLDPRSGCKQAFRRDAADHPRGGAAAAEHAVEHARQHELATTRRRAAAAVPAASSASSSVANWTGS